jgi:hypothetical protein
MIVFINFRFAFLAFKLGLGFLVIMSAIFNLSIIILLLSCPPFECSCFWEPFIYREED